MDDFKNGELHKKHKTNDFIQCEEGPGVVAYLLTLGWFNDMYKADSLLFINALTICNMYQASFDSFELNT